MPVVKQRRGQADPTQLGKPAQADPKPHHADWLGPGPFGCCILHASSLKAREPCFTYADLSLPQKAHQGSSNCSYQMMKLKIKTCKNLSYDGENFPFCAIV